MIEPYAAQQKFKDGTYEHTIWAESWEAAEKVASRNGWLLRGKIEDEQPANLCPECHTPMYCEECDIDHAEWLPPRTPHFCQ